MSIDLAPDYFDPHDVLCGEQRVKVRFNQAVPWNALLGCEEPPTSQVSGLAGGKVR